MITDLSHTNRAASHAVATALVPKSTSANRTTTAATIPILNSSATAGTSSTASSTASASTITSSDFLTLLVGELKNQDPTQPTDPNSYITQLVGVNSLEQLISINSGISSLDSAATSTTNPTTSVAGSPMNESRNV